MDSITRLARAYNLVVIPPFDQRNWKKIRSWGIDLALEFRDIGGER
jgi:transcription termination factor Rho